MGYAALPDGSCAVRGGAHPRRRRRCRRGAAALSRGRGHGQHSRAHGQRDVVGVRRLPRPALERARPDEGRDPLRPARLARRVRRARDVDDVEVRTPTAALRRRERRSALQPARDVLRRAPAHDAALHDRAPARDRPGEGHPRPGHGHERADHGLDDGHVLDADRLRGSGDRDRQADRDRWLGLPQRGDRGGRRHGHGPCVPAARLEAGRAGLRRPGVRQRRSTRSAATSRSSTISSASTRRTRSSPGSSTGGRRSPTRGGGGRFAARRWSARSCARSGRGFVSRSRS